MKEKQSARVLEWMKGTGPITQFEAIQHLGILRLAARINDLRREGHDINSSRVSVKNRFGERCSVVEYSLGREAGGAA